MVMNSVKVCELTQIIKTANMLISKCNACTIDNAVPSLFYLHCLVVEKK